MVVTKTVHWGDSGTEPTSGVDDDYAVNEQPVAEWDNWFNKATETDIAALITALQNVTTGHDHDGTNSKTVDASDVVNASAGTIVATDVQAAIDELDSEKAVTASDSYAGNNTTNRAIPHGLTYAPSRVSFVRSGAPGGTMEMIQPGYIHHSDTDIDNAYSVTSADSTNFYVGNASSYSATANGTGITYNWVAV